MPYIDRLDRIEIDAGMRPKTAGHLTYKLYQVCRRFIGDNVTFAAVCTVIGALFCTALEIYRRVAVPHEDARLKAYGDVS